MSTRAGSRVGDLRASPRSRRARGMRMSISTTSGSSRRGAVDRLVRRWRPRRRPRCRRGARAPGGSPRARATGRRRSGRGCSCAPSGQPGVDARSRRSGARADVERRRRRARRARASRPARGRRRRRAAAPSAPRPSSAISSSSARGVVAHGDRTRAPAPACLSAFVSASWTIRYAARSTPGRQRGGLALDAQRRPAARRARARSASSSTRGEARRGVAPPSRQPEPASAAQLGERLARRRSRSAPTHSRARSGSRSTRPSAPPAWIAITLTLCATASCSSRATRTRSAVTAARASRARGCARSRALRRRLSRVSCAVAAHDAPDDPRQRDAAEQRGHDAVGIERRRRARPAPAAMQRRARRRRAGRSACAPIA